MNGSIDQTKSCQKKVINPPSAISEPKVTPTQSVKQNSWTFPYQRHGTLIFSFCSFLFPLAPCALQNNCIPPQVLPAKKRKNQTRQFGHFGQFGKGPFYVIRVIFNASSICQQQQADHITGCEKDTDHNIVLLFIHTE